MFLHSIYEHLDQPHRDKYARALFIDFSSAFNTVVPTFLNDALCRLDVPLQLRLWLQSFLVNRTQIVKLGTCFSNVVYTKIGAPQGCVLSALLFSIYTDTIRSTFKNVKIIKYADDIVIIGLILNCVELSYLSTIASVTNLCSQLNLQLNANKTKELIFDFRKPNRTNLVKLLFNGSNIDVSSSIKYLGVYICDNLSWSLHINSVLSKCRTRLHVLRKLKKYNINSSILQLYVDSSVLPIILYCMSLWFKNANVSDIHLIERILKKCKKLVGNNCNDVSLTLVYNRSCLALLNSIMKDPTHPLYLFFQSSPRSSRIFPLINRLSRTRNSFVYNSIHIFNVSIVR